jgi:cysteine desulfurase
MDRIYLDNAATTPIDPMVVEHMADLMKNTYGNPSSVHSFGRDSKVIIEDARERIAAHLNIQQAELFFTSGGTEAINTIFRGLFEGKYLKQIITSPVEHPAILRNIELLESQGVTVHYLPVDRNAIVNLKVLEEKLEQADQHTLVCLAHANNELGTILPIEHVGALCKEKNAMFMCDTVQTMGKLPIDLSAAKIDFAFSSAHKLHGPKGVGFMYINGDYKINPAQLGGGQEQNMRGGTENIYGISGMAMALDIALGSIESFTAKIASLRAYLVEELKELVPDIVFNSPTDSPTLYNILNVGLPRANHNDMLVFNLDISGIAVSGGSACSSGAMQISHVIEAIAPNEDLIPMRVSFSKFNTKEEVDSLLALLKTL